MKNWRFVLLATLLFFSSVHSALAATTTKKVAVILFNFQNDTSSPTSAEEAKSKTFTAPDSVAAFYQEASGGQLNLSGDVFGRYTIDVAKPVVSGITDLCPTPQTLTEWANSALQRVKSDPLNRGVDFTKYDIFVFNFPAVGKCKADNVPGPGNASGLVIPAQTNYVYINGLYTSETASHEIGHVLGLSHSNVLVCVQSWSGPFQELSLKVGYLGVLCPVVEYADPYSVMGSGYRLFNAFQLWYLGWLNDNQVKTVNTSQTVSIDPLYSLSANIKLIRIPLQGTDPSRSLYLEYQRPFGQFNQFDAKNKVSDGILVRIGPGSKASLPFPGPETVLVDGHLDPLPADADLSSGIDIAKHEVVQATLNPGDPPIIDPDYGISIKTLSVSPAGAKVEIKFTKPQVAITKINNTQPANGVVVSKTVIVTVTVQPTAQTGQ